MDGYEASHISLIAGVYDVANISKLPWIQWSKSISSGERLQKRRVIDLSTSHPGAHGHSILGPDIITTTQTKDTDLQVDG